MTAPALPPGLDDLSTRRLILGAIDRKRQQLRWDGLTAPDGLLAFAAWLENVTVTQVEAARVEHRRALSRASSQRHRDRLRAGRQDTA